MRFTGDIAQEVEFTVENMQLYVLETQRAKRKPLAAVKIAVDMVKEGILTEREALLRVEPSQMEYFLHPMIKHEFSKFLSILFIFFFLLWESSLFLCPPPPFPCIIALINIFTSHSFIFSQPQGP
jgi:hypothetical protein